MCPGSVVQILGDFGEEFIWKLFPTNNDKRSGGKSEKQIRRLKRKCQTKNPFWQSREDKAYTSTTTKGKSFGKLGLLPEKLSRLVIDTRTLHEARESKSTVTILLCGPYFFRQRKRPRWTMVVYYPHGHDYIQEIGILFPTRFRSEGQTTCTGLSSALLS